MSAEPSEIVDLVAHSLDEEPGWVQLTCRVSRSEAAVILEAAGLRHQPVLRFARETLFAEALRVTADAHCATTATTGRLGLINEVFDRLAAALSESEKSLHTLGDLIERTHHSGQPTGGPALIREFRPCAGSVHATPPGA